MIRSQKYRTYAPDIFYSKWRLCHLLRTMQVQHTNFHHDLQVIYGLLEIGALSEAKDYIKEIMSQVILTTQLIRTDNIFITETDFGKN